MQDTLVAALARVPDGAKAEIVRGEIQVMSPTGDMPGRAALRIVISLVGHDGAHARPRLRRQRRLPGGAARPRLVLPGRRVVHRAAGGDALPAGAPAFAVEVRSAGDYGPRAERAMAEKRADYFAAGTLVVWDVDLLGEDTVRGHRATNDRAGPQSAAPPGRSSR